MNSFWSVWIIVLTVITLVGVLWLLLANRKSSHQPDKNGEGPKTGHVYDGIEEYDNPLPAWWMNMFLLSILFAVAYLIAYPGMGSFKGMLHWTQQGQYEAEVQQSEATFLALYNQFPEKNVEALAADKKAVKMGQRLFANNCSVCHGADAGGTKGYPNLRDGDWLWGGSGDQIKQTIAFGRNGAMPAWGAPLGEEKVMQVTQYVKALSEGGQDNEAVAEGKAVFGTFCFACHGASGEGNIYLGAPRLNDTVWLYGGSIETIAESVRNGRAGVMPAHTELLSEERIQLIAAFVYSLSHSSEE